MPGFIKPQLATLKSKALVGSPWLHEIKFDSYRVQIHLNKGRRKVYTRNGLDWTKRFAWCRMFQASGLGWLTTGSSGLLLLFLSSGHRPPGAKVPTMEADSPTIAQHTPAGVGAGDIRELAVEYGSNGPAVDPLHLGRTRHQ
jgi:hypothetical protein